MEIIGHEQRVAAVEDIDSVPGAHGPVSMVPVPVFGQGIWRTPIDTTAGFTAFVPHDATTGVMLRGVAGEAGTRIEAWSMADQEPVLLIGAAILPSVAEAATSIASEVYGLAVTPMGDRTGWYLAYDAGGSTPAQVLYSQLVHIDGSSISVGPEFSWDEETHNLVAWGSQFLLYSHQIIGIDETTAVRLWVVATNTAGDNPIETPPRSNRQNPPFDVAIHVELIEFDGGIGAPPTVTDLGKLPNAPQDVAQDGFGFWAIPVDGHVAVYWNTFDSSRNLEYVSVYTAGAGWSAPLLLRSEPVLTNIFVFFSASLHDGYVIVHGSLDDWVLRVDAGGATLVAQRAGLDVFTLDGGTASSITALADTTGDGPTNAYLTINGSPGDGLIDGEEQVLTYRTLAGFDQTDEQSIVVQDYVAASIIPLFISVFSFGKLAATHEVMLPMVWSDGNIHAGGAFITHVRFGPPPRGIATIVGHQQGVHSRDAGP